MKKGKAGRGISVLTTYRYRRVAASTIPLIEESPFEPRFLFLSVFYFFFFIVQPVKSQLGIGKNRVWRLVKEKSVETEEAEYIYVYIEREVVLQPFSRLVSILDAPSEPRPTTAYITVLAPFSPSLFLFCRRFMPFVPCAAVRVFLVGFICRALTIYWSISLKHFSLRDIYYRFIEN